MAQLPNRLAKENSPYLRQHALNPVEWYPWGDEAFEVARSRDVPVLLSIGYSACHWCHVMAHQSFEDPEVAEVMNTGYVCVKVDREERPDVDTIYMEAVQAVTGSGGWPMTVFLLPDGRPFHGGTYYPRTQFVELLTQIREMWGTQRSDLEDGADRLAEAVRSGTSLPSLGWAAKGDPKAASSPELLNVTADSLLTRFDAEWGGFGRAPKFPQPPMLETLLLAASTTGRPDLMSAVVTTLDAMASGGIYDHLAGGFARYSTDRTWLVPHFEKMLYDNALLAPVYLHAWQRTGLDRYRQVVTETLEYLLATPMRIPGAGLASAEDADSEGVEGRFYVWDQAEVLEAAGEETAAWYGVTSEGNWEGTNILWRPERGDLLRSEAIEAGRLALLATRNGRVRPGLDGKVLTEWNAMAVSALAECGAALGQTGWVAEAESIATFLLSSLRRPADGRWLRSWQEGTARHLAYASDHAWVVEAFTRLAEATGRARWIDEARTAAEQLIQLFWVSDLRAFATTGIDAESLIARPVDTQDGALPSSNSVATSALLRLSVLTGEARYADHAMRVVEAMGPALDTAPVAFTGLVRAAHLGFVGLSEVVITGDRSDLLDEYRQHYLPTAVLAWGEPYDSPLWEGRTGAAQANLGFVCHDYACRTPAADRDSFSRELGGIHPFPYQFGQN
jgi:uncharacterized protein YyaL (SSP411 family)